MYSPDGVHIRKLQQRPKYSFDSERDFLAQQKEIGTVFTALLGERPEEVELDPKIEAVSMTERATEYRIAFSVEQGLQAICLLSIPRDGYKKHPLMICLQGHSPGMYISMGRSRYGFDAKQGDRNYGEAALAQGFAVLALEQRGMGERRSLLQEGDIPIPDDGKPRCLVTAMGALLVGRTLLGERCFDVSRAIDLSRLFPEIDETQIYCTGNSGGGTTAYYAACLDKRIQVSIPCCGTCTYKDSIGAMPHCGCNYIPRIAQYLDMGDLAALIAPRKLIVAYGKQDKIFPQKGVQEMFGRVREIYTAAGAPQNCLLVSGDGGHRYYWAQIWQAVQSIAPPHWE